MKATYPQKWRSDKIPRYIDADKLIKLIAKSYLYDDRCYDWSEILSVIADKDITPTEDVQPVVHAKWKKSFYKGIISDYIKERSAYAYVCSNCKIAELHKSCYCRYCGAKMDKE